MMIRIGFSRKTYNPLSWIIRKITRFSASHVFFIVDDPVFGLELVVEATEVGFRAIPFEKFRRTNKIVAVFDPKHDLYDGFKSVSKNLGGYYDFFGLFGMIIVLIRRWLGKKVRNPFNNNKSMFCSEAVSAALNFQNYPGWVVQMPDTVDPKILYEFFLKESLEESVEKSE